MLEACERAIDAQMRPVSPVPFGGWRAMQEQTPCWTFLTDSLRTRGELPAHPTMQIHLDGPPWTRSPYPCFTRGSLATDHRRTQWGPSPASLAGAFVLGGERITGCWRPFPLRCPRALRFWARAAWIARAEPQPEPSGWRALRCGAPWDAAAGSRAHGRRAPGGELGWEHYGPGAIYEPGPIRALRVLGFQQIPYI